MPDADETTARDRAMAIITVADADYADALAAGGPSFAARIVDALLAHPEVLRALASAPTADVAGGPTISEVQRELRRAGLRLEAEVRPVDEPEGMDVEAQGETADEDVRDRPAALDLAHQREVAQLRQLGEMADELTAAQERDRLLRHYFGHIVKALGRPVTWDALSNPHELEHIGEGVLAELDRRGTVNSELKVEGSATVDSESGVAVAPADELTAAQAAIERVEAVLDDWQGVEGTSRLIRELRRALDGDATEPR